MFSKTVESLRIIMLAVLLTVFHVSASHATVRITNMNDIALGSWNGSSSPTGNDAVCVYKSTANGSYTVTGTDNSTITAAQFRLENAAHTVEIPYTINWSSTSSPGAGLMTDGTGFGATGANKTSQTCAGGRDANFKIDVTAASLNNKPAGSYTATVSFLVQ
jgi:hypothetical protein